MSIGRGARSGLRFLMYSVFAAASVVGNAYAASVTLNAAGADGKIDLSWSVSGNMRGVQVMRDTDADPSGRQRVAVLGGNARSYTDSTVTNGRQYWYWIKYTDTAGASGNSNAGSATPAASGNTGNTGATCANAVALALPKVFTGVADTCLVTGGTIDSVNSWGADTVEINGVSYKSKWSNQMPARINGNYYIRYVAKQAWAHFEINGNGGSQDNGNAVVNYTLAIAISGNGSTSVSAGSHSYKSGTAVTITATPASGQVFSGWSGAVTGNTNPLTLTMNGNKSLTANFSANTAPSTFKNPMFWEDFADVDVFRVDDTFYASGSNMHFSPGAPILRSYDLVNWEFAGHSVPVLDFSPKYDMNGGRAYVKGTWASFLNYRKSNKTFYWGGCIEFSKTYIYTATSVEGPWQKHPAIDNCYYDAGLLIDDDDTMYVAYGATDINVAQLSPDGLRQVKTQKVFNSPEVGYIEGSRFYKINGSYYIFVVHPNDAEYVLKSSGGPFGPYTMRTLVKGVASPIAGASPPHQGGIVQTQNGEWYYMAFVDAWPGGRIPVLAPVEWDADGWPAVRLVGGAWGTSYPQPVAAPHRAVKGPTGVDSFGGATLGHEWEWNHNPDNSKWSAGGELRLQTATVTNDLYSARNTLTHRVRGPSSTATIELDYSGMRDGDRAGLALLRDTSAWVGVRRDNGATRVVMVNNLTMDSDWNTTSTGTEVASAAVSGGKVWLRATGDFRPGAGRQGSFSYSTDGRNFKPLGNSLVLTSGWKFFMGYRFAIFNYATQALGGSVRVDSFGMTAP